MVANRKPPKGPLHPERESELGPPREDAIVVLEGATWADFERILAIRGARSVPRLAFLAGNLELMTPSRYHESIKSTIGRLIEAWCLERGVDVSAYGSWTLKAGSREHGLEPDECYVVGDVAEGAPEPERPDLAIEVVWTSGGVDKLAIYAALGVREVWCWRSGALALFELKDGSYAPVLASAVLPGIDHAELARFIALRPMTKAVREYRDTLRMKRGGA